MIREKFNKFQNFNKCSNKLRRRMKKILITSR